MPLLVWIFLAVFLGVLLPGAGVVLKEAHAVEPAVFLIFVFSGLTLRPESFARAARNVKALALALVSVNVISPFLALVLSRVFGLTLGGYAGLMVVATAPTTLASGIIISVAAGGSRSLAMLITLAASLAGVFIQPLSLKLFLSVGGKVEVAALPLLLKLFVVMVVPAALGALLSRRFGPPAGTMEFAAREAPKLLIGLVVYVSVSHALPRLLEPAPGIGLILPAVIVLHALLLLVNHRVGRGFGFDAADLKSFTIVSSQKTLPITLFICLNHLAHLPLAPIPGLLYHLVQIPLDTVVAQWWLRATGGRGAQSPDP